MNTRTHRVSYEQLGDPDRFIFNWTGMPDLARQLGAVDNRVLITFDEEGITVWYRTD